MSPTVPDPSMTGIGITSNSSPCTCRKRGTRSRKPAIIPSLPRSNHSTAGRCRSSSGLRVIWALRSTPSVVSSADRVLSSENVSVVGSVSSSKIWPSPETMNGANPDSVASIETPLLCRRGRVANSAAALNCSNVHARGGSSASSEPGAWRPARAHPVEVDELGVVVDDHRRDAVGHALQPVVEAEGAQGVSRVAVAEVDPAGVEQLVDRLHLAVLLEAREVTPRDQEDVGQLVVGREGVDGRVAVGPGDDADLGRVVERVELADHVVVAGDLVLGPEDPERQLRRLGGLGRAGVRRGRRLGRVAVVRAPGDEGRRPAGRSG